FSTTCGTTCPRGTGYKWTKDGSQGYYPETGSGKGREGGVSWFKDDDRGFERWRDSHPHGYIVNTYRSPSANYLVLHQATCTSLRFLNSGQYWTKDYIKICSTDAKDLQRWAERAVGRAAVLKPCGLCRP